MKKHTTKKHRIIATIISAIFIPLSVLPVGAVNNNIDHYEFVFYEDGRVDYYYPVDKDGNRTDYYGAWAMKIRYAKDGVTQIGEYGIDKNGDRQYSELTASEVEYAYYEDACIIEGEHFRYQCVHDHFTNMLESDLLPEPNLNSKTMDDSDIVNTYMVIDTDYTRLYNGEPSYRLAACGGFGGCDSINVAVITKETIATAGITQELQVGDFVEVRGGLLFDWEQAKKVSEDIPIIPTLRYLGNGVDLLGADFQAVIDHEKECSFTDGVYMKAHWGNVCAGVRHDHYHWNLVESWGAAPTMKQFGDVNSDDAVDVLDCVIVNKNLMVGTPLTEVGIRAADMNHDGYVTETDSLCILKHILDIPQ